SLFMTDYRAVQSPGTVAFATKVPGHIVPVPVAPGSEYMVHRHGFLCATPQVAIGVGFQQSLGAGIFGGSGFLIQKDLAPGETLRVHPGHVGAFQASVGFQITTVPGIKNAIFGGDGIFLASLTGPGTVWLQILPISRLAHQIAEYLPRDGNRAASTGIGAGLLGGVVGSLLGGDNN